LRSGGNLTKSAVMTAATRIAVPVPSGWKPQIALFEEFQNADPKQIPQLLSDHPANGTRIRTLKEHFRDNPSVFAKFDSRPESASPFVLPKDASERFLRP
jgi:hypothetical protein